MFIFCELNLLVPLAFWNQHRTVPANKFKSKKSSLSQLAQPKKHPSFEQRLRWTMFNEGNQLPVISPIYVCSDVRLATSKSWTGNKRLLEILFTNIVKKTTNNQWERLLQLFENFENNINIYENKTFSWALKEFHQSKGYVKLFEHLLLIISDLNRNVLFK